MTVQPSTFDQLSNVEVETVRQLAISGDENRVIAQRMGVKVSTVKWHLKNIMDKVGVENRTSLALLWVRHQQRCLNESDADFIKWLEETLIPDLFESEQHSLIEDFTRLIEIIRSEERWLELKDQGVVKE